jgi:hypothetical protein
MVASFPVTGPRGGAGRVRGPRLRSKHLLIAAAAVVGLSIASAASAGSIAFTTAGSSSFVIPVGVTSISVIAIGGGGGGANGHQGGGGAGYLTGGVFGVTPGEILSIVVGAGGNGAATADFSNNIVGLSAGGASKFGQYLTANGGGVVSGINQGGHNGSSGGGGACNSGPLGGAGGSGGSNGGSCTGGNPMPIGIGQGNYSATLAIATQHVFTPGAGGAGGTGTHAGGGGAGGILMDGLGPTAENGLMAFSGKGGAGFGAGGGAGGFNALVSNARFAGGDGASGLVYAEWLDPVIQPVPEPAALGLLGLGVLGLAFRRRRASFPAAR